MHLGNQFFPGGRVSKPEWGVGLEAMARPRELNLHAALRQGHPPLQTLPSRYAGGRAGEGGAWGSGDKPVTSRGAGPRDSTKEKHYVER